MEDPRWIIHSGYPGGARYWCRVVQIGSVRRDSHYTTSLVKLRVHTIGGTAKLTSFKVHTPVV